MTEMSHVRKPWIASSLSLICTGLGQIYCGKVGRGLMMYCASLLFGPALVLTAMFANYTPVLAAFLVCLAGLIGLLVYSVRDARAIARQQTDFHPHDYNRAAVYMMLAATSLTYVVGLTFFIRSTVLEAFVIPSSSMAPTFVPGDRILVTKMGLSSQTFERGDLVVFRNPINRRQNHVKRVIGLPGETVEIKDGQVIIDGKPLERAPIDQPDPPVRDKADKSQTFRERAGKHEYLIRFDNPQSMLQSPLQKVAPDAYFVLGDHRDVSLDSREVGNIPHGLMVGIVRCIYFPGDNWSRFGAPK